MISQICLSGTNGCKKQRAGNKHGEICCCTGDRCNSANTQGEQKHVVGLVASAAVILRLFI